MEHWLYYWKISCIIGRPIVVLEGQQYYWKSTALLEDLLRRWKMNGRSKVLLENQLYWRQSTGLDGNYHSRKITARRWLHKYSEQNAVHLASPDSYIKCATAIKPPKAACQFAADDILLYKFAIISNGFTSPFGKKEKKNCHLYNTILSLYISYQDILRSQIYRGYEELSTDTNYPIWRRQKLPYMKKTRKKKQVCGAACFMAAEIKFSEDVRPSHLFDYVSIIVSSWNFQELLPMTKVTSMQKVKVRGQRSRSQKSTAKLAVSGP